MTKKIIFTLLAFFLCVRSYAQSERTTISITINTASTAQEILGFGASSCWWAPEVGGFPEEKRREILRLLYNKKDGIGMTIHRHNLGANTIDDPFIDNDLRRTESMLNTKTGILDWSRDANACRIMREAVEAGAEKIILFVNSPPVSMTINGHGRCTPNPDGERKTNLAPERYADFAKYLGEITERFLRIDKLPIVAVSPINEPGHAWDKPKQEGCFYTPEQSAAVLKVVLDEFKRRSLPVRIEPTDQESWAKAIPYFEAIRRDPALYAALMSYGVHSYDSKPAQKQQLRAWFDKNCPDARLHMTEWCDYGKNEDPRTMGGGALTMARVMIEDFTIGRAHTWQYWRGAAHPGSHDGLVYYDPATQKVITNKLYWVMGQFSHHLAKGSVVLDVKTQEPDEQVYAMAARLPDGRVALICANLSDEEKFLNIKFPQNENWFQQFRAFTDDKNDYTVTAASNVLPSHSVVTIIFEKQK